MIFAMCMSMVCQGMVIGEIVHGAGRHEVYLSPDEFMTMKKINFVSQPFFLWTAAIVKISIGLFLRRIAPNRLYRILLTGVIAFITIYTFICFLFLVLQCKNLAYMWDESAKTTCLSIHTLQTISIVNSSMSRWCMMQLRCSRAGSC